MTIKERWASFVAKLKGARKSLTIWANALAAGAVAALPYAADQLPQLQPYLGASLYQKIGFAIVVCNMILRFRTTQGLHEK